MRTGIPKAWFTIGYAGYVGILAFVYWRYISIIFSWVGFHRSPNVDHILITCLLTLVLIFLMPKKTGVPSSVAAISLILLFGPTSVYVTFGTGGVNTLIITSLALAVVFTVSAHVRVPVPVIPRLSPNALVTGIFLLTAAYFVAVIYQGGLQFLNFDLREVYEYRDEAAENLSPIFAFISPVLGKVFIPFLSVWGVARKRYVLAALGIGLGVLLFGLTAQKSPLFYGFVAVSIYFLHVNSRRFSMIVIGVMIAVLCISAFDFYRFLNSASDSGFTGFVGSLFARRVLMVPSQLNDAYLTFFSSAPHIWWADSKITFGLFNSPYTSGIPHLIGAMMFGKPDLGANTGFVGSGFANGGVIGVLIYSLLFGIFVSFLDSASKFLSARFVISVSFSIVFTMLLSADFLTALLTHGALGLMLLFSVAYHRGFGSFLDHAETPVSPGLSEGRAG